MLLERSGNRENVAAACRRARGRGVRSGMSAAEARSLCESAWFLTHDADGDRRELDRLAVLCGRYSPQTAVEWFEGECGLVLDISGCARLFGGEARLVRLLVIDLSVQAYFVHAAAAGSPGAAWAIARYGHRAGPDRRLRSLPVEALRIPAPVVSRLRELGLDTIRSLMALPPESLPSRFGPLLSRRLDQLLGRAEELLVPVRIPEPTAEEWETEEPVDGRAVVESVCLDLLARVVRKVVSCGHGLLTLTVRLTDETKTQTVLNVRLTRPERCELHLRDLLRLKLDTVRFTGRVQAIRLEAADTAVIRQNPSSLFPDPQPIADPAILRRLTDRLIARLGSHAVVRPQLCPEAIPEQAVEYRPLTEVDFVRKAPVEDVPGGAGIGRFWCAQPLLLLSVPEPIQVHLGTDGTIRWMQRSGRSDRIVRSTCPERLDTGWWQATGPVQRNYFQVETHRGARFWIFQDRQQRWFLHGMFE